MTTHDLLTFLKNHNEALTIIIASIAGLVAFGTFIKAILEYRLQGRQKRAELFDTLKNRLRTDEELRQITDYLESDNEELKKIPQMNKYYFLGFYEQIAIAVNSKLIKKNVAHYFFGYYAKCCSDSENFRHLQNGMEINTDSYYWATFKRFVEDMNKLAKRRANPTLIQKAYDKIFYKRLYRF